MKKNVVVVVLYNDLFKDYVSVHIPPSLTPVLLFIDLIVFNHSSTLPLVNRLPIHPFTHLRQFPLVIPNN
jgi:hypothetical protein